MADALIAPSVTRRLIDRFARHLPPPETKPPPSLGNLTDREVEVLTLMARGLSNAELAADLRRFASEGISHVQLVVDPITIESIDSLAGMLEALDR